MHPSARFRPATPADADAAVPLIYSSGPDAFDYVFCVPRKANAQDFLRAAFLGGDTQFGWRNHVVVELDGRLIGIGAAWGSERTLRYSLQALRRFWRIYGWRHVFGVLVRGLRTESVIRPPRPGCLYIAHLGIAPECRSQGLGHALLDWFAVRGRTAYRTLALDVAVTNPRAQALYERLGFRVCEERISNLSNAHGSVPSTRYMERSNTDGRL